MKFELKILSFIFLKDKDIISVPKTNEIDMLNILFPGFYTNWAYILSKRNGKQEDSIGLNDDLRKKGFAFVFVSYLNLYLNALLGDKV